MNIAYNYKDSFYLLLLLSIIIIGTNGNNFLLLKSFNSQNIFNNLMINKYLDEHYTKWENFY